MYGDLAGSARDRHSGDDLRELWRYRTLIVTLAARQLRLRYKNSAIGVAWSLIIPLVQVFTMTAAIGFILGSGPKNLGIVHPLRLSSLDFLSIGGSGRLFVGAHLSGLVEKSLHAEGSYADFVGRWPTWSTSRWLSPCSFSSATA